jgi:hypothetical protein
MSNDGISYSSTASVRGAGTSTIQNSYSVVVPIQEKGIYYFRLKQIDLDGSSTFSNIIQSEYGVVKNFSLSQNYPNPFNSSTLLEFSLPTISEVILTVYSIDGRQVDKKNLGSLATGNHSIRYEAGNLTSGNYIFRINAGSFTASKKFTYLK